MPTAPFAGRRVDICETGNSFIQLLWLLERRVVIIFLFPFVAFFGANPVKHSMLFSERLAKLTPLPSQGPMMPLWEKTTGPRLEK